MQVEHSYVPKMCSGRINIFCVFLWFVCVLRSVLYVFRVPLCVCGFGCLFVSKCACVSPLCLCVSLLYLSVFICVFVLFRLLVWFVLWCLCVQVFILCGVLIAFVNVFIFCLIGGFVCVVFERVFVCLSAWEFVCARILLFCLFSMKMVTFKDTDGKQSAVRSSDL